MGIAKKDFDSPKARFFRTLDFLSTSKVFAVSSRIVSIDQRVFHRVERWKVEQDTRRNVFDLEKIIERISRGETETDENIFELDFKARKFLWIQMSSFEKNFENFVSHSNQRRFS